MNVQAEAIRVDSKTIACDGGGGQLGHPRVYLAINDDGRAVCPYCGQIFIYAPQKGQRRELIAEIDRKAGHQKKTAARQLPAAVVVS